MPPGHGSAHGQQARGAVVDIEALNDELQGHCSHVRREVEEAVAAGANPLTSDRCCFPCAQRLFANGISEKYESQDSEEPG